MICSYDEIKYLYYKIRRKHWLGIGIEKRDYDEIPIK